MPAGKLADFGSAYIGHYNFWLLVMAVLIAGFVTFVAFSIATRVQKARQTSIWLWRSWWLAGSVILGLATWSAHFICMLAFSLPVPVSYSLKVMLVSMLPAMLACSLLLKINPGPRPGHAYQWLLATAIGAGFALMHYLGMASMRMDALITYDPLMLAVSVAGAIFLAVAALSLKYRLLEALRDWQRSMSLSLSLAVVVAMAVVVINFSTVYASDFFPSPGALAATDEILISSQLMISVASATVAGILVLLFAAVQFGYRMDLEALVRKESVFSEGVLNTTMEGVVRVDGVGCIRSFSPEAERIFRHEASTVIGRDFLLLLPDKLRELLEGRFPDPDTGVVRYINRTHRVNALRSDGTEFPAEIRIGPIHDHGMPGFIGVIRDISDQVQAETEQKESQHRLRLLLHASPVVSYTCALTGSSAINYVSPNIRGILGFEPEEITSTPLFWQERIHPEDKAKLATDRKTGKKRSRFDLEYRIKCPDGNYRWIADTQSMICDDEGTPVLLAGSWTDIHQRKVAEMNSRLVKERLRISLESNKMATWDWVMHSGEFNWCPRVSDWHGLPQDMNEGFDKFISTIHSEDQAAVKAAFRQSLVRGDALDEEYRVVWPDKSVHWMHSVGSLINDHEGHPKHMVGIMRDISEQKQLRVAAPARKLRAL